MLDPTHVIAAAEAVAGAGDSNSGLYTFLGQVLGGGAVAGALVLVLWKTLSKVADRFLIGFDNIVKTVNDRTAEILEKVDDHTSKDLQHHAEVSKAVSRLEGKFDAVLEWQERTPVHGPPPERRTPNPISEYGPLVPARPGTSGGGGGRRGG